MNNHKGQSLILEGNGVGEFISNLKNSFDAMGNIEYSADCKLGMPDGDCRHFITKFIYDGIGNLTKTEIATNQRYTGATDITVDLTNPQAIITCTNGDFREVLPFMYTDVTQQVKVGDRLYINTILNPAIWVVVEKIGATSNSVIITAETSSLLTAEVGTPVLSTDIILELNHDLTKPFDKRRWDIRSLYLYL